MMKVVRALGEVNGPLFVTTENESVMLGERAKITVHIGEDGPPLLALKVEFAPKQGADGDWYDAAVLREVVQDGRATQSTAGDQG